uniref:RNA polymerase alpha subunit n=1 Tax=Dictyotopsis propagulifera TaxID=670095 RepID=UPI002E785601|nr:RNA polymerase alpha subunit [Dictyotopsis propagulifera]WAM63134.1 RNA polymerase alpha subunit [Dictyotopsis propagulifera]
MKRWICRELSLQNAIEFYGHFIFTSLEPGEGITLANMVRRTLLSSLPGSKIVGVKISNASHEFCDVIGIREDILEILLNLKEVIIKNPLNCDVCFGKMKIEGPVIVTAGLIKLPKELSILNPQHYLFTISEQIFVELEVKIEHGKSYVLATDRKLDEFLPIDANFTPILNVEYHIQPMVEYFEKSHEELHMMISTNGTLLPQEALLLATNNLSELILGCRNIEPIHSQKKVVKGLKENTKNHLVKNRLNTSKFNNFSVSEKKNDPEDGSKNYEESFLMPNDLKKAYSNIIHTPTKTLDLRTIDIEITCLPTRILSTLRKAGINVMSELLKYSSHDLQKLKGLGPVSVKKIKIQVELFFEAISLR